jgi:hypothetical protein
MIAGKSEDLIPQVHAVDLAGPVRKKCNAMPDHEGRQKVPLGLTNLKAMDFYLGRKSREADLGSAPYDQHEIDRIEFAGIATSDRRDPQAGAEMAQRSQQEAVQFAGLIVEAGPAFMAISHGYGSRGLLVQSGSAAGKVPVKCRERAPELPRDLGRRHGAGDQHGAGRPDLRLIQCRRPATDPATSPRCLQSCSGALPQDVQFHGAQGRTDDEDEAAGRGRGVDGLVEGSEADPPSLKVLRDVDQMPEAPGNPVQAPTHDLISRSGHLQKARQFRAVSPSPGPRLDENPITAGLTKSIKLEGMVLLVS